MRTIKTYFKGAPFYIASASRNVTLGAPREPIPTFREFRFSGLGQFRPNMVRNKLGRPFQVNKHIVARDADGERDHP